MDGQVAVFDSRSGSTPCYACLFPPDQQFEEVQCSTMGVFAPLVGIIGTVQAAEALKLIMGIGESLANRLLLLDARNMEWTSIRTTRSSDCPVCAGAQS
jgi:molybdopterin/thiamine biosynthesis adenylyltransferase